MPKVSDYTRTRIEVLDKQGLPPVVILRSLKNEGLSASLPSVTRIVKKLRTTGSVANLPRSGRPKKLSEEAKAFIDQQMQRNDEMTSSQIQKKLEKYGISVCSATVRRTRKKLGWTLQKTAYCQLIRTPNKTKRLEYARCVLESGDTFDNVIFTDECSVFLQQYRRTCYRKIDEPMNTNQNRSIQLKFMFGVGLVDMVPQRFVSLMASWMLFSSATSLKPLWSHSLERSCLIMALCKIMTQSIPQSEQRPSLRRTASTGGKRPLKNAR